MSDSEQAGPTAEFLGLLGTRLRKRRLGEGWTVQELADRAGVSRRMLTQIELGQANPSLVTVDKIARALGTDFPSLTVVDSHGALSVLAPGLAKRVWSSPLGSWAALHQSTSTRPPAELWEWMLMPHDLYEAQPDPLGSNELFLVLEGTLTIHVAGERPEEIDAGGSARLASDRTYQYANHTDASVRFIRVVHLAPN